MTPLRALLVLLLAAFTGLAAAGTGTGSIAIADLPFEAATTLRLIDAGGPFPHKRDGAVFGNREKHLPARPRGYYREYTVATPGAKDRGARRIIAGATGEHYYTANHYRTFHRIHE